MVKDLAFFFVHNDALLSKEKLETVVMQRFWEIKCIMGNISGSGI